MALPTRLAVTAVNMNTRSYLVRPAKFEPHPATKAPVLVAQAQFVTFPGALPVYFNDQNVKSVGFAGLKDFIGWFQLQPFLAAGEVIFSACLGRELEPVANMDDRQIAREITERLLLPKPIPVEEGQRAALLDLRRLAGESVVEPKVAEVVPETVPPTDDAEEASLTKDILGSLSKGR